MNYFLFIFATTYFLCISSITCAMNAAKNNSGNVLAVAYLYNNTLALGATDGCYLLYNPHSSNCIKIKLCDHPTDRLITDNKKQKLGLLSQDIFLAYDAKTKNELWRYQIYNKDFYSAAFSETDDTIFVYKKGEIFSNKRSIPFTITITGNDDFAIACHPKEKHILYPLNDFTVFEIHHDHHHIINYDPIINDGSICSIFCHADASHIAFLTKQKNIFIYNLTTKDTHQMLHEKCNPQCNLQYLHAAFLSTEPIIAALCNFNSLHFWNFKTQKSIAITQTDSQVIANHPIKINNSRFAFSHDDENFVLVVKEQYSHYKTPDAIKKDRRSAFAYWLLQQYSSENHHFIPQEIIRMLTRYIIDLHE